MKTYIVTVKTVLRIRAESESQAWDGGQRIVRDSLPYGIPRDVLSGRVEYPATVTTESVK